LTCSPVLVTTPDEPETEAPQLTPDQEEEGITPPEPGTLPEQPDVDAPEPERLRASSTCSGPSHEGLSNAEIATELRWW
jgi:hypothetical protein